MVFCESVKDEVSSILRRPGLGGFSRALGFGTGLGSRTALELAEH